MTRSVSSRPCEVASPASARVCRFGQRPPVLSPTMATSRKIRSGFLGSYSSALSPSAVGSLAPNVSPAIMGPPRAWCCACANDCPSPSEGTTETSARFLLIHHPGTRHGNGQPRAQDRPLGDRAAQLGPGELRQPAAQAAPAMLGAHRGNASDPRRHLLGIRPESLACAEESAHAHDLPVQACIGHDPRQCGSLSASRDSIRGRDGESAK
jgi:hypothetical protein